MDKAIHRFHNKMRKYSETSSISTKKKKKYFGETNHSLQAKDFVKTTETTFESAD